MEQDPGRHLLSCVNALHTRLRKQWHLPGDFISTPATQFGRRKVHLGEHRSGLHFWSIHFFRVGQNSKTRFRTLAAGQHPKTRFQTDFLTGQNATRGSRLSTVKKQREVPDLFRTGFASCTNVLSSGANFWACSLVGSSRGSRVQHQAANFCVSVPVERVRAAQLQRLGSGSSLAHHPCLEEQYRPRRPQRTIRCLSIKFSQCFSFVTVVRREITQ